MACKLWQVNINQKWMELTAIKIFILFLPWWTCLNCYPLTWWWLCSGQKVQIRVYSDLNKRLGLSGLDQGSLYHCWWQNKAITAKWYSATNQPKPSVVRPDTRSPAAGSMYRQFRPARLATSLFHSSQIHCRDHVERQTLGQPHQKNKNKAKN